MTNLEYETARNLLIPEAVRYANDLHGVVSRGDETTKQERQAYNQRWSMTFMGEMDRLARERGIVT